MPAVLGRRRGRIVQDGWPPAPVYPVTVAAPADRTLYAFNPPAGFAPIIIGNGTSQTATIQAYLDYVKEAWGGGVVDVAAGGGTIYCGGTTGLNVPAGAQLRGDLTTRLSFPDLTSGSAITVNDHDFGPLADLWIEGPNANVDAYPSGNASVGLNVIGIGLKFTNIKIQYFGAGINLANNNTFIHDYDHVVVGYCGVCVYDDGEGNSVTENGERIVFSNFTFFNSALGVWATGNGLDLHLIGGSIDYCTTFGLVSDSWLYFTNCHLETAGITSLNYLLDVRSNSHVHMSNTDIIMSGRGYLFNPGYGPSNYAYGVARFSNVNVFYVDSNSNAATHWSTHMVFWAATTTSMTIPVPWPLRWCTIAADFVATDGYTVPNNDKPVISGISASTASVTVTAPSNANDRWLRLVFG